LPRAKRTLLKHCRPTLAADSIGFLTFRASFDATLAAILTVALLLLGAAAGTNSKSRF